MRIEEISIRIGPSKNEDPKIHPPIVLRKGIDKLWQVVDEHGYDRGLHAVEVALAYKIQTEIIEKFNSGKKDE